MGEDFLPASRDNPAGYFEDEHFRQLQKAYREGDLSDDEFEDRAYGLLKKRAKRHDKWGWKTPNTAENVSYFRERLDDPKWIIANRPMDEVEESMKENWNVEGEEFTKRVRPRMEGIKEVVDNEEALAIDLEETLEDPMGVVEKLVDYCDLNPSEEQKELAAELVTQDRPGPDTKIKIALPNEGWLHKGLFGSVIQMSHDPRYEMSIEVPSDSPIEKNRLNIVEDFLEDDKDFDYLLMIDSDNPPKRNPLDLVQLDKDIIGCPTPTVQGGNYHYAVYDDMPTEGMSPVPPERQQAVQKVDVVGTGCILIARRVLEELDNPFSPIWEDGHRTGEDVSFCRKARDKGFNVWAHWDYTANHVKERNLAEYV